MEYKKCAVCGGSGQALESMKMLSRMDPEKYKEVIERYKEVYETLDRPSQKYSIPCPLCNGGQAQSAQTALKRANIPKIYQGKRMIDFKRDIYMDNMGNIADISSNMKIIDNFINNFWEMEEQGQDIFIYSNCSGSGKTLLAVAIIGEILEKYAVNAKFFEESELLEEETTNEIIKQYCSCRLLVIDNVGQQQTGAYDTDKIIKQLYKIIKTRYENNLITIYTARRPMKQLCRKEEVYNKMYSRCITIHLPEYNVGAEMSIRRKNKICGSNT